MFLVFDDGKKVTKWWQSYLTEREKPDFSQLRALRKIRIDKAFYKLSKDHPGMLISASDSRVQTLDINANISHEDEDQKSDKSVSDDVPSSGFSIDDQGNLTKEITPLSTTNTSESAPVVPKKRGRGRPKKHGDKFQSKLEIEDSDDSSKDPSKIVTSIDKSNKVEESSGVNKEKKRSSLNLVEDDNLKEDGSDKSNDGKEEHVETDHLNIIRVFIYVVETIIALIVNGKT